MNDCPGEPVNCPECGTLIGHKHHGRDGMVLLRLAGSDVFISRIDAKLGCGHMFHWRQTDEIYYRLMRHYPELATGAVTP